MPSFKSGKKDLIIIAGLLFAALAFWGVFTYGKGGETGGLYAEIIYDGELVEKVYLNRDRTFSTKEAPNVEFQVKDGKIAFVKSDCPDKVCVHTGWLDADGHFAACLPNRLLLWVVDENAQTDEGADGVAR